MNYLHLSTLGEIASKIGSGATPKGGSNSYKADGISLIRSQNVLDFKFSIEGLAYIDDEQADELKNVTVEENDILLNITGDSVARCCIVPRETLPARVNQHVAIIRVNYQKAHYRFIFYLLQEMKAELLMQAEIGATRNALTKGMLESLPISIPSSLAVQKKIADVLTSLDDKIDLLHRQNKTLEAMGETLFRQWFVEDAQENWIECSVSDFADHAKENVIPQNHADTLFSHYSIPAFDNERRPTFEPGREILSNKFKVLPYSILVSKLNPRTPRIWPICELSNDNSICSTEFQVIKPKSQDLFGFILFLLRSNEATDALIMAASGTSGSHQRVRPEDILNIGIKLPSETLPKKFSDLVMPNIAKMQANLSQIQTLEKLRDTLLPKLLSGEVRVEI